MAVMEYMNNMSEFVNTLQQQNNGNVDAVLKNRIIIDTLNDSGMCPIGLASHLNNFQFVKSLLEKGEDVNAKGENGMSALHIVCNGDNNQQLRQMIVKLLLQHKIKIDEKDRSGRTALHMACDHNQVMLVDSLISSGCNVKIQDHERDTAFTIACRAASESWYFWNNDYLNDPDKCFERERFPPYLICRAMLKAGADSKQATLLPSAILYGNEDMVKEFLHLGMDVNLMDENRRSPLGCACSAYYIPPSMVRLLLEKGADVIEDGGGRNMPVIGAYVHNSTKKIKYLLSYRAVISNEKMSEIVSVSLSKWFLENPEVIYEDSPELLSWKLLLKAGFRPQMDLLMLKLKRISLCSSYTKVSPWIFNLLFPLPSLKDICRVSIRSKIPVSIDDNVASLPLPNSLKDFLRFSEIP